MHVVINPDDIDWSLYIQPVQFGGGYFIGNPYQRGYGIGSLFTRFFRYLLPMAQAVGAELGREGLAVGARILDNVSQGGDMRQTVVQETSQGLRNLANRTPLQPHINKMIDDAEKRLIRGTGRRKAGTARKRPIPPTKARRGRLLKHRRLDALGFY